LVDSSFVLNPPYSTCVPACPNGTCPTSLPVGRQVRSGGLPGGQAG